MAKIEWNGAEGGVSGAEVRQVDVTGVHEVAHNDQAVVNVWCVADRTSGQRRPEAHRSQKFADEIILRRAQTWTRKKFTLLTFLVASLQGTVGSRGIKIVFLKF